MKTVVRNIAELRLKSFKTDNEQLVKEIQGLTRKKWIEVKANGRPLHKEAIRIHAIINSPKWKGVLKTRPISIRYTKSGTLAIGLRKVLRAK